MNRVYKVEVDLGQTEMVLQIPGRSMKAVAHKVIKWATDINYPYNFTFRVYRSQYTYTTWSAQA